MIILPNFDENIYPITENGVIYNSPKELVLNTFGGLNSTVLDKICYKKFSSFLQQAPKLEEISFPYTYQYVEDETNKNKIAIENELKNIQIYLSCEQTIYHGGLLPIFIAKIGETFKVFKLFSASIDPYTASMHAIQKEPEHWLWIIKLKNKTRIFPVQIDGQEECEVIILDGLDVKITDIKHLTKTNKMGFTLEINCVFLEQI